jgi:hypothetical protein
MNRPKIKTYEDLLQEEQRLFLQLKTQEELIKQDFAGIKEGMKPVNNVLTVIKNISTRDRTGPLINFGLDFGIDLVVRKFLLAKAGWFTKIVIPFLIKNYSSHLITEDKRIKLVKKIQNILNKVRPKPDTEVKGTYTTEVHTSGVEATNVPTAI